VDQKELNPMTVFPNFMLKAYEAWAWSLRIHGPDQKSGILEALQSASGTTWSWI
jgi:hypothetical protein